MSNVGKPDRQLWYDMRTPQAEFSPQTHIKFQYGDILEQLLLLYAKMAGHDVQNEQLEVEIDGIKGHLDCTIDGVVVDIKSASSMSFQKFESGSLLLPGNDPFGYVAQLASYVHSVTPGCGGAFFAVDKTLGKLCLLKVPGDVLDSYRVEDRIRHIKEVVSSEVVPEKCHSDVEDGKSGNRKLGTQCSYCSHKHLCWPDLKTYYYSGGPRYLTVEKRKPKVSEFPDG